MAAAGQMLTIATSLLVAGYVLSAFYTGAGEFVISLDRPMADEGFLISNTKDFSDGLISLVGDAIEEADNISIFDIDKEVQMVDGPHNGMNYVAYTFYLKNKTKEIKDYQYEMIIRSTSKGADEATWFMVFENEKMDMYAKANKAGHAETQYSKFKFPFVDAARNPKAMLGQISDEKPGYITQGVIDYHEFVTLDGVYELTTTPFESDNVICRRQRTGIEPGGVDKYTVVIWLEGEDPECVDAILGGHVEVAMKFSF